MDINTLWFILVAVLLMGYAVLDGFDLGIGILHLTVKKDEDRRILMNSIGPIWHGNEVWLVTGGGALFAAFPNVYATVFSGFYLPFILFLAALIFRAVSLEFRSKVDSKPWRTIWDIAFFKGSFIAALLLGIAFGNIVRGIPLSADQEFAGTFLSLLNPFSLFFGVTSVIVFAVHGATYLTLKTRGALYDRFRFVSSLGGILLPLFVATTTIWAFKESSLVNNAVERPLLLALPILALLIGATSGILAKQGRSLGAFISSCTTLVIQLAFFYATLYPNMVYSPLAPENSLTIYNASSSPFTLKIMLIITCLVLPLVIAYTIWVYRVFKGKVDLESGSY